MKNKFDEFDLERPISRSYIKRKEGQLDWDLGEDEMFNLMLSNLLTFGEQKLLIRLEYNPQEDKYFFKIYGEKHGY